MANLDDLVTVQKNGVIGINLLTEALSQFRTIYEGFVGSSTSLGITQDALIVRGAGRLVNVVVNSGAGGGTVHDAASVTAADATNILFPIPTTTGVTAVNMPFTNGLVVLMGATTNVSISYAET